MTLKNTELLTPCVIATASWCTYTQDQPGHESEYYYFGTQHGVPVYVDASQVNVAGEINRKLHYITQDGTFDFRNVTESVTFRLHREGVTYVVGDPANHRDVYYTRDAYYEAQRGGTIHGTHDLGTIFCSVDDLHSAEDGTVFYSDGARDEYDERQRNDPNNYRTPYHNGANNVQYLRFGIKTPQYLIGLEIEKEDIDILRSIQISDFHDECPKWRKEADGSLNHDSGFELISPVMELDPEMIAGHIEANPILSNHVNAEYSDNCGMHANLSDPTRTPWELFDDLYGYLPVLCALYPTRANNTYCKAMPKHTATQNNAKYQALTVKSDRVEIRIFPAVTTTENLKFRLQLLQYMMQHPAPNAKLIDQEAMLPLFESVHRTESQRASFAERFAKYVNILRA
jgi:hypothetical protein